MERPKPCRDFKKLFSTYPHNYTAPIMVLLHLIDCIRDVCGPTAERSEPNQSLISRRWKTLLIKLCNLWRIDLNQVRMNNVWALRLDQEF